MTAFKSVLFFSICSLILFISCQKDDPAPTTPTVPLSRTQLLVQKEWQVDALVRNLNGSNTEYIRGGVNTTGVNYDKIKIRFNADGSGTYTNENGVANPMTWLFSTADQRSLTLNVGPPNAAVYQWKMIEIKDNYLHSTSPHLGNILVATRYIQIP